MKLVVATAITENYISNALPFLLSTEHLKDQAEIVCITLGFNAPEYLTNIKHVSFVYMDKNDVLSPNKNNCIQHGVFIKKINRSGSKVVMFCDADIIIQRKFTDEEYKLFTDIDNNTVMVNFNVGKLDTLNAEYKRLKPKTALRVLEDSLFFNAMQYPCYNTGVVIAKWNTWTEIYKLYNEHFEIIDLSFEHYAKQQWLLSFIFTKYFKVKILPAEIHTHGHAGIPYYVKFNNTTACINNEPIVFAHKLIRPKKRIRLLFSDNSGCVYYRMIMPFEKFQNAYGSEYDIVGGMFDEKEDLRQYDMVMVQRGMNMEYFLELKKRLRPDAKLVWDGDDDYFNVDDKNDIDGKFKDRTIIDGLMTFLRNSDAIIVSTEYLKSLYSQYTDRKIYVLENVVDVNIWESHIKQKDYLRRDGIIRIGWHGGSSHLKDFRQMVDVIVPLLKKYPHVRFCVVGWDCTAFKEFDSVRDQIEFTDWQPLTMDFGRNIANFDIGIAPLDLDIQFNKSKSAIKFFEYSMMGIPTVASDVEPYRIIEDGVTGYLVRTKEEWLDRLDKLINSAILMKDIGFNAYNYVYDNHNANKNVYKTKEIIEEILK